MRKAKLYLGIILISTFLVSCSGNIEMTESKTFHFHFADLTLSVPKNWKTDIGGKIDGSPIYTLHIKGIMYKKDYSIETISFYFIDPRSDISDHIYPYSLKECSRYGNNYVCIRPYYPMQNYKLGYVYINDTYCLGIVFESLPRNEVTPELAALFRSINVELKRNMD